MTSFNHPATGTYLDADQVQEGFRVAVELDSGTRFHGVVAQALPGVFTVLTDKGNEIPVASADTLRVISLGDRDQEDTE